MHSKKQQNPIHKPTEPGDFFLPYVNLPRGKSIKNSRTPSLASDNPEKAFTLAGSTIKEKHSFREPTALLDISIGERRDSNASRRMVNTSSNHDKELMETGSSRSGRLKSSFADSQNRPVKSIFSQREVSFRARYAEKYRIYYNGLESTSVNMLPSVYKGTMMDDSTKSRELYSTNFFTPEMRSQPRLKIGSQNTLSLLKEESEDNEYSAVNWTSAQEPQDKQQIPPETQNPKQLSPEHSKKDQTPDTEHSDNAATKQKENASLDPVLETLGWTRLDNDPQLLLAAVKAHVQREQRGNESQRLQSKLRGTFEGEQRLTASSSPKIEATYMKQVLRKFVFGGDITNQQLMEFGSLLLDGIRFVIEYHQGLTSYQLQAVPLPIIFPDIGHHDRVLLIEPFYVLCYPVFEPETQNITFILRQGTHDFLDSMSRYWKLIFYSSRDHDDLQLARDALDPENRHKIKLLDSRYCARLTDNNKNKFQGPEKPSSQKLLKDLSVVADVPLSRKCLLDYKLHGSLLQPNNTVVLPAFDGTSNDGQLSGIDEYLRFLALSDDVGTANPRVMGYYDL